MSVSKSKNVHTISPFCTSGWLMHSGGCCFVVISLCEMIVEIGVPVRFVSHGLLGIGPQNA